MVDPVDRKSTECGDLAKFNMLGRYVLGFSRVYCVRCAKPFLFRQYFMHEMGK